MTIIVIILKALYAVVNGEEIDLMRRMSRVNVGTDGV